MKEAKAENAEEIVSNDDSLSRHIRSEYTLYYTSS